MNKTIYVMNNQGRLCKLHVELSDGGRNLPSIYRNALLLINGHPHFITIKRCFFLGFIPYRRYIVDGKTFSDIPELAAYLRFFRKP